MENRNLDEAIVDPKTYGAENAYHEIFIRLRKEDPVHWTAPAAFRPFWTVTKHADILEIEKQNDRFLNNPRVILQPVEVEQRILRETGGQKSVFKTLVQMDNPEHRAFRGITQAWFMPPNLKKLEADLRVLAKEHVDRMEALGGECDFVTDVAVWYPLRVIMTILGVPPEDEPLMLKLTQEVFGATDPEVSDRHDPALLETAAQLFDYFRKITEDRRRNPRDDVATVIANATIDGEPVNEFEALSYYVIVATAGHDTTSSSVAGGLLALMQNPDEFTKLRERPELLPGAIDEMIRWTTPVKHFFRTATEDYELRGKQIKAGDNLLMCYWSANRDEEIFDDPFAFRIDRSPNKHIAFGYGAHLCLGQHLAKMEIRALYEELLSRLDHVELLRPPAWVEASFVSGLKHLPVRYRMKKMAA